MKFFHVVLLVTIAMVICGIAYICRDNGQLMPPHTLLPVDRLKMTHFFITRKAIDDTKLIIHSNVSRGHDRVGVDAFTRNFERYLNFDHCRFSNCRWKVSNKISEIAKADVVLAGFWIKFSTSKVPGDVRKRQTWLVYSREPASLEKTKWDKMYNEYDGKMTYTSDSDVYLPWGEIRNLSYPLSVEKSTVKRTKGAYVYVSNCKSTGYDRMRLIEALRKYIGVDIFGGYGNKSLCNHWDQTCRRKRHSQYRFYLSFENTLCTDYITERFWSALRETDQLPVVVGGLSIDEYYRIAPPNSFIHAYNFTSFDQFGQYLRRLMVDDVEYNKYHAWRTQYVVIKGIPGSSACQLCQIANQPNILKHKGKPLADHFNNETNCRKLLWKF